MVMEHLQERDQVAYVRFASVYRAGEMSRPCREWGRQGRTSIGAYFRFLAFFLATRFTSSPPLTGLVFAGMVEKYRNAVKRKVQHTVVFLKRSPKI